MSAGAERFRERSVVFAAFALAAFLAGAIFDFGKSLTLLGALKHIIEGDRNPVRDFRFRGDC
jgi:hypothetical protein